MTCTLWPMTKVFGMINIKGGVGKTALTVELADALASSGHRVLCVDMDPQANLSRRLGHGQETTKSKPTLSEAIKANEVGCAADIVLPCTWGDEAGDRISLMPARFDLENRETEAGIIGADKRLARAVTGVFEEYDYVLIDYRPSLGHLTRMAMVATGQLRDQGDGTKKAGQILLVVAPEFDSMLGAVLAWQFVPEYREDLNVPDLAITGVIVNMVRVSAKVHANNLEDLARAPFGHLILEPNLPLWTVLTDAHNDAVPLRQTQTPRARELRGKIQQVAKRIEEL
jgi:cellulose biosynthesis protein BcsQ